MTADIMEIFGLSYRISTETKTDIMVYYYGHVNSIDLDIYIDGYGENEESKKYIVPINREPYTEREITLATAIKLLKEILKRG